MSETTTPNPEHARRAHQLHADSTRRRFTHNTTEIVNQLRVLAEQVERDAEVRPVFGSDRQYAAAAERIQHAVAWGVVNLNLPRLTGIAAEADATTALLEQTP